MSVTAPGTQTAWLLPLTFLRQPLVSICPIAIMKAISETKITPKRETRRSSLGEAFGWKTFL
jgi:hypothetical protein